jgi:predicted AlkP superfamily phosphohydrolase/phosphomutase
VATKVMIIGLDCAEPSLVLERWRGRLPTISGLMDRGTYGRLTSVIPPITVPAWSCMMASRTPGDLGVYGFRNRSDHSYDGGFIATSTAIQAPRLWDLVTRAGGSSIVLGVPGTYPPRPLSGVMVSCFLTPSLESRYTYPAGLREEIEQVVGEYVFDTKDFRTDDKAHLLGQVYEMTDRRFALAEHLLATRPWSLFVMVEMGPDRMHHGFWKFMDPEHRKHEPGNPYETAILDYHEHVDGLIARLLEHADDDTVVFVLSDHGAKRLDGGIRINEWLRREGLLRTLAEPQVVTTLAETGVDWSQTVAWGEGGYYARVFLNVKGREPEGVVEPSEYEGVRDDLGRRLAAIPDDAGNPIPTAVYKPEELYQEVNGVAPDLIVVFGDLLWRSVGTIGGDEGVQTLENDTGPDDANHAQDGLYVVAGPGIDARGRADAHLLDIAPTVLELLGIEEPEGMRGKSLLPAPATR